MKKLLCLLLAMMLTLSLAACKSEDKKAAEKSDTPKVPETITFQEQVLVDNEECMIQITGIDPEGEFGYTLNTTLKNKSAEKTYVFALTDSSVNGVLRVVGYDHDRVIEGKIDLFRAAMKTRKHPCENIRILYFLDRIV